MSHVIYFSFVKLKPPECFVRDFVENRIRRVNRKKARLIRCTPRDATTWRHSIRDEIATACGETTSAATGMNNYYV